MPDTFLAHFSHRWEAEFAQGFLDDAGVPSRLVSDDAAGGSPYMGGLAGATLFVAPAHAEEARAALESAGLLRPAGEAPPVPLAERPLPPVLRAEAADIEERLRRARKAEMRHVVFMFLGITPAAVVPLVGLALEGNVALMALLCVLVVFVEGWRWIRAGREVQRLEDALARLEEEAEGL